MRVGDFFVELGVDADSASLRDFTRAIGEIPLKAITVIGALTSIGMALKSMLTNSMDAAVGLQQYQAVTGLSIDELQKWQRVAAQMNVDGKTVASTIIAVQQAMERTRMGTGDYRGFNYFGIDPNHATPIEALEAVRKFLRDPRYDRATIVNTMQMMGIPAEMAGPLALSREEFEKMSTAVKGMDSTQLRDFLKTKKDLVEFGQAFEQMSLTIASSITKIINSFGAIPKMIEMMHSLNEFISSPKPWEKSGSPVKGPGDKALDWLKEFTKDMPPINDSPIPQGIMGSIKEAVSNMSGDKNQTINQNVTINNHGSDPAQTSAETVRQLKTLQNNHADQYFGVTEQ